MRHNDGLTVLDIVKHAVKAVVRMLDPADRLSVIAFDQAAETTVPLTHMNRANKQKAEEAVDLLRPRGNTNIWGGLLAGLDSLRKGAAGKRNRTVMLLTDGQPNVVPPKGHIVELHRYFDTHPDFHCQVNTFGFGYNVDSNLLLDLGKEGKIKCVCRFSFSFSPLCGFFFLPLFP